MSISTSCGVALRRRMCIFSSGFSADGLPKALVFVVSMVVNLAFKGTEKCGETVMGKLRNVDLCGRAGAKARQKNWS